MHLMTGSTDRVRAAAAERGAAGLAGCGESVRTVTLPRSPGAQGGAVPGAPELVGTLPDTARSFTLGTGRAPARAGVAPDVLDVLDVPEITADLPGRALQRTREPAAAAREPGLEMTDPPAAVGAVVPGPPPLAPGVGALRADRGVRMGCFRPPSVPRCRSCPRLTAGADLRSDDLAVVRGALTAVAELTMLPELGELRVDR